MDRWLPWVTIVGMLLGWVWYAATASERLRALGDRVEKLEKLCHEVPTLRALLDAGIGGRRAYRAPRATADDAPGAARARGNIGALRSDQSDA